MIVLIDNYDSFVHNLARYIRREGKQTMVLRNDALRIQDIAQYTPEAIMFSPGPGTPQDTGICLELIRTLYTRVPMLGVCLGHQSIAQAFGANIQAAQNPKHGMAVSISYTADPLFTDIPNPFHAGLYHSLAVCSIPAEIIPLAQAADGTIMAIKHRSYPVYGVQFHPESILTPQGSQLIRNFLALSKIP